MNDALDGSDGILEDLLSFSPMTTPHPGSYDKKRADSDDPQESLTLLESVIATGFQNDGQAQPSAGQDPSLTSSNNFINFCATVLNLNLTNGEQNGKGSCNPAPMGILPSTANMPSCKFVEPTFGATILANTPFTVQVAVKNIRAGSFTNSELNYLAAPQMLDTQGLILGYSRIVVEEVQSLDDSNPTDPTRFSFFKSLIDPPVNDILSANVSGGLPVGTYRIATNFAASNHQPVLVPIEIHGALGDMIYFSVVESLPPSVGNGTSSTSRTMTSTSVTASTTTTTAPNTDSSNHTKPRTGMIVGVVVGCMAVVILATVVVVVRKRQLRLRNRRSVGFVIDPHIDAFGSATALTSTSEDASHTPSAFHRVVSSTRRARGNLTSAQEYDADPNAYALMSLPPHERPSATIAPGVSLNGTKKPNGKESRAKASKAAQTRGRDPFSDPHSAHRQATQPARDEPVSRGDHWPDERPSMTGPGMDGEALYEVDGGVRLAGGPLDELHDLPTTGNTLFPPPYRRY